MEIYDLENATKRIVIKDNEVSGKEEASGDWSGSGITLDYRSNSAVEITGNTVENMRDYGIFVNNNHTRTEARIEGNTVKGNGQAGLRVYGRVLPVVTGNTFDGHRGGLILTYTDSTTSGEFEVSGNAIGSSSGITSTGGYGVRIEEYAQPNINGNDLDGRGGYVIDNQTNKEIDAKNNWWGEVITQEMATGENPKNLLKVYDKYDDANKGFVNYGGWLSGTALDPDNPPSAVQAQRGVVSLTKGDGRVVAAYEAGDRVFIRLKDSDRNGDGGVLDEVRVLLTSETENTGTHASAGDVTAGSDNQGDGVLTVLNTGYDTKTEEWTVTCVNVEGGNPKFDVVGSVSGNQTGGVTPTGGISYRTDGGEVAFRITQGSTGFGVLDSFKFPTTAGEIKGEQITLKETGADTGVFSAEVEMDASGDAASDAKLQISSGDYVTVFYDDPKGILGIRNR